MALEIMRHRSIFNPSEHEVPVIVAGCGATGSHVALMLACLGVTRMYMVDPDVVEEHNLPNQIYFQADAGSPKVEALIAYIDRKFNEVPRTYSIYEGMLPNAFDRMDVHFSRDLEREPVLILAVDSMAARLEIVEHLYRDPAKECRVVDTRMASSYGNVISFDLRTQFEDWKATLIPDEEAEMSPCGAAITVIPTVQVTAGLAVWEYINYCTNPAAMTGVTNFFLKPLTVYAGHLGKATVTSAVQEVSNG